MSGRNDLSIAPWGPNVAKGDTVLTYPLIGFFLLQLGLCPRLSIAFCDARYGVESITPSAAARRTRINCSREIASDCCVRADARLACADINSRMVPTPLL